MDINAKYPPDMATPLAKQAMASIAYLISISLRLLSGGIRYDCLVDLLFILSHLNLKRCRIIREFFLCTVIEKYD